MKKKILAIMLACTLVTGLAVSPVGTETVWAEDNWEEEDEDNPGYGEGMYQKFSYAYHKDGTVTILHYRGTDTVIRIPEKINGRTVTEIAYTFGECSNVTSIEIPSSVTHIGQSTFEGCSSLTSINIPSNVEEIGSNAFEGCSSLTSIKIPSSVTDIGSRAFYGCSSLTSITIPSSVKEIEGQNPFGNCSRLEKILVEGNGSRWVSEEGVLYSKDGEDRALISYPAGKDTAQGSISEDATIIGTEAFIGCSKLTSITIPSNVTWIESSAFTNCSSLASVTISPNVKNMTIGEGAFGFCSSLTSITIPSGVTEMRYNPFLGCSQLKEVVVEGNDPRWVSKDDVLYSKDGEMISYLPGKGTKPVRIPEGVSSIGQYAFAFSGITDITIPKGVTEISMKAFLNCSSLTSVVIPEGVKKLNSYTFNGCSSLASVTIPLSMEWIDIGTFGVIVKDVYYAGSKEQWSKIRGIEGCSSVLPNVHYNSTGPADSTTPGTETPEKPDQIITAENITKTYGAKAFSLNAKVNTGTALTYVSSNKKVATIDKKGKITIKGCGITNITITAPATGTYNQTQKTITLTVKPKKATLSSVKSTKKKTAAVTWTRNQEASGYLIQCATDSKFKKNKVQVTVSKNKTVSTTVKKLKAGKKYYVRVCAYAKSGQTKVQGSWSKVMTVKVKK